MNVRFPIFDFFTSNDKKQDNHLMRPQKQNHMINDVYSFNNSIGLTGSFGSNGDMISNRTSNVGFAP
jgi:hypothetical protein